ncbi:MAG: DmsE family decaheme c-type cytochrome, partial [Acidobacteria bacterium]|nr:DmsE family decaheme c-type cytochrome [Acidobacteriota bacterium]
GIDVCKGCHEDLPSKGFIKNFEATPHYKTVLDTKRGPEFQGCEACHGAGTEHVNAGGDKSKIFNFKNVASEKITERCMKCHQFSEEHSNFARSRHNTNQVNCASCHSIHSAKEKSYLLRARQQSDLCYSCHMETKPDFSRPFRHRVNEGLIKCTDCHNPHGGFLMRQLRSTPTQDAVCFKCHAEKAGPFVYEHAPVKTEGCVACHTPHGSSNPRLLRRSQVNLLCLECHTLSSDLPTVALPSFHNQTQKYQACTLCHTQIHGSNTSDVFFK